MDEKKDVHHESPNIDVVKHHQDSLPSWDELKYFIRKYYLFLLIIALVPVVLYSLGQQLANRGSAAPLLRLNSGTKISEQIITSQNVVLNEATCFGICTPWDKTRVAQCGPYAVLRLGCGNLNQGCAWTGGNDQCYIGPDLKVHYCGQLCPDPTPTIPPPDSEIDNVYCENNQVIFHYKSGDTIVRVDCVTNDRVCVPGVADFGPNTAGCREKCTTAEACCKYAISGIPNDIATKCVFNQPICFQSSLTGKAFTETVTCRVVEGGSYCDNDGEQICDSNMCNADNSGCAESTISIIPIVNSTPTRSTTSPIPTSIPQIPTPTKSSANDKCYNSQYTPQWCLNVIYNQHPSMAGYEYLTCVPTYGGNCMAVNPTRTPSTATPTFVPQGGGNPNEQCQPGAWETPKNCGKRGCSANESARCKDDGSGWYCVGNPSLCG